MEQLIANRKADLIAALENALEFAHLINYDNSAAYLCVANAIASARYQLDNISDLMSAYDDDETETIADVILPLIEV